jgi:hypothetical protein
MAVAIWERLKGWKTVIIGAGTAGVVLLLELLDLLGALDLNAMFSAKGVFWITAAIGVLKIILRVMTTTPVGGK